MLEIICVPVIVSLVFVLMEIYKKLIAKENEKLIRIIPIQLFSPMLLLKNHFQSRTVYSLTPNTTQNWIINLIILTRKVL